MSADDDGPELIQVLATGMVIDTGAETEELLRQADELTDARRQVEAAKRTIAFVIAKRADRSNARSIGQGRYVGTVNAPFKTVYDAPGLLEALDRLVTLGVLDPEVRDAVVPQTTSYAVSVAQANLLAKHADPRVREALEAYRRQEPQGRTVTVEVKA